MSAPHEDPTFVLTDLAEEYLDPETEPTGVGAVGIFLSILGCIVFAVSAIAQVAG